MPVPVAVALPCAIRFAQISVLQWLHSQSLLLEPSFLYQALYYDIETMDPITVLGVVSDVIDIIQTGIKIASDVNELYRSETGVRSRHQVIEQTATELSSTCSRLLSDLGSTSNEQSFSPAETALRSIALKCNESAKKLLELLEKLKAKPRRRDALLKTIRARWKRDQIDELQKECKEYQNALGTHMLEDLWHAKYERQLPKQISISSDADALRNTLWFPEMYHRQEQIDDAHAETFQWIFCEPDDASRLWDNFVSWLQDSSGLYWVNGKVGSGKSTMMNYISHEARTRSYLEKWSNGHLLVVANYFFLE